MAKELWEYNLQRKDILGGFSEKSPSNFPNCPIQRILFNHFLPGPLCCLWDRGIFPHFLKPSVSLVPLTVISPPSLPTPLNSARLAPRPYPLYVPHQQNGWQIAGTHKYSLNWLNQATPGQCSHSGSSSATHLVLLLPQSASHTTFLRSFPPPSSRYKWIATQRSTRSESQRDSREQNRQKSLP